MARSLRRFEPQELAAGTDNILTIGLFDASGAQLVVTGVSAEWKVFKAVSRRRRRPFKGDFIVRKTSAAGEIALTLGLATITIGNTDFGDKSGEHWHVLQLTDAIGEVSHFGGGPLHIRRTIL